MLERRREYLRIVARRAEHACPRTDEAIKVFGSVVAATGHGALHEAEFARGLGAAALPPDPGRDLAVIERCEDRLGEIEGARAPLTLRVEAALPGIDITGGLRHPDRALCMRHGGVEVSPEPSHLRRW